MCQKCKLSISDTIQTLTSDDTRRCFRTCEMPQITKMTATGSDPTTSLMPAKCGSCLVAWVVATAMSAVSGAAIQQAKSSNGKESGARYEIFQAW